MSLAEALERERLTRVVRVPCTVSVILARLTPTDRDDLLAALRSDMSHAGIARALRSKDHAIAQGVIARHRNGECSCDTR